MHHFHHLRANPPHICAIFSFYVPSKFPVPQKTTKSQTHAWLKKHFPFSKWNTTPNVHFHHFVQIQHIHLNIREFLSLSSWRNCAGMASNPQDFLYIICLLRRKKNQCPRHYRLKSTRCTNDYKGFRIVRFSFYSFYVSIFYF